MTAIPKILHFTWKTKTLPRFFQDIFDAWHKTHSDWEIRLYDDADVRSLVAEHYPEHLATFDSYPAGIFRADAFRIFVLHRFGGVYSDLDVMPLRHIDELIGQTRCFVGAEPELHVINDDVLYRGMSLRLCNAFMGSVPGHPFWQRCLDRLADCNGPDVIDATGPRFINGIALTEPREIAPDVLLPNYWSPLTGFGKAESTSSDYADRVARYFNVIGRDAPALVSHLWRNSWSRVLAYKGPEFWRVPNDLKWAWRRLRHADLAKVSYKAPSLDYDNQSLCSVGTSKSICVCINLDERSEVSDVAIQLAALSYPRARIQLALCGPETVIEDLIGALPTGFGDIHSVAETLQDPRNALLTYAATRADFALILGQRTTEIPSDVIEQLLSAQRPIVSAYSVFAEGGDANDAAFLYVADVFKHLYRRGARQGVVAEGGRTRHQQMFSAMRYLNIVPLTCVGDDLLLIDSAAVRAGARFAETPYKFHLGSQGLAIQARDLGFEVCGLPGTTVTVRAPGDTPSTVDGHAVRAH